jgi:hypothetical protein
MVKSTGYHQSYPHYVCIVLNYLTFWASACAWAMLKQANLSKIGISSSGASWGSELFLGLLGVRLIVSDGKTILFGLGLVEGMLGILDGINEF